MKLFDIGPEAHGFIAVGQFATGVFAFGQLATGVVAIGQLARGVVVVGQLAIGVFVVGQLGIGLLGSVAMIGIAGRWAKGLVWPVWGPSKDVKPELPAVTPLGGIVSGVRSEGWIRARLVPRRGEVLVEHDGQMLDVTLSQDVARPARELVAEARSKVLLRVRAEERIEPGETGYREAPATERVLVATAVRAVPPPFWADKRFWLRLLWRVPILAALAAAVWLAVIRDLLAILGG